MADPALCEQIVAALERKGCPVTGHSNGELREALGLDDCSTTQFKRALGSLIDRQVVTRSRPQPDHIMASSRPITVRLHQH